MKKSWPTSSPIRSAITSDFDREDSGRRRLLRHIRLSARIVVAGRAQSSGSTLCDLLERADDARHLAKLAAGVCVSMPALVDCLSARGLQKHLFERFYVTLCVKNRDAIRGERRD